MVVLFNQCVVSRLYPRLLIRDLLGLCKSAHSFIRIPELNGKSIKFCYKLDHEYKNLCFEGFRTMVWCFVWATSLTFNYFEDFLTKF